MTRPVSYLQTDPRWGSKDYSAKGEKTSISASGCGPTAMAMVLATWADASVNPETECAWALAHGFKAPHQGTYYGYFVKAAARYNLSCQQLNGASIYGNANSPLHEQAKKALNEGCLVIACMGKGNWTRSGHYVLVYDINGDIIYINDPASTLARRTIGDYALFKQQVKYYWVIKPPKKKEDELDMTIDEMIGKMTDKQAYELLLKAQRHAGTIEEPEWVTKDTNVSKAKAAGVIDGTRPEAFAKRDEVAAMLGRILP